MVISDYLFFPQAMFHSTTLYVWGSFMISGLIGLWLKKHQRPHLILGGTLIASLQFFLVTNFGVWTTGMYSRDINGLFESYVLGLPFYRYTLLGDLFYTVSFFGLYRLVLWFFSRNIIPQLRQKSFAIDRSEWPIENLKKQLRKLPQRG